MGVIEAIGAGIVAALALIAAIWRAKRKGAEDQRSKDAKETIERVERGRQAVQRGRDSGDSPADRLRRNDGNW